MKKLLLIIIGIFGLFHNSFGQNKVSKALTHEIMTKLKKVGAPAISPDGKFVVYSQVETSYNLDEQTSDLWLAPSDGKTLPRKITSTKGAEDNYFWSPAGDKIYFTSKRDGDEAAQLYSLPLNGGEAQRITSISTGVSAAKLSLDGHFLAFTSRVYPVAFTDSLSKKMADEKKKVKTKARVYTSFPIRYWDSWLDEKQAHIFTMDLTSMDSQPINIFKEVSLVKSPGFNLGSFSFTPDNKSIVFSASTDYNTTAYQSSTSNLFQVNIQGGKETQLTSDGFDYATVDFSSDGKFLITSASENGNKLYYINRLFKYTWPSMSAKTELAAKLDRPLNDFKISGSDIFASIEDQGVDRIIKISLGTGETTPVLGGQMGSYTSVSSTRGGDFAFSYQHLGAPPEVFTFIDGQEKPISKSNDKVLSALDVSRPEVIWTVTSRGKKVRSFVLKPAGFDPNKKYPLFVMLHGGPASSFKDIFGYRWNPHIYGAAGYVIIMTDYTGSVGYGEKFAQDIQFDPFKGPAQEILEAAADAIKRFTYIDGTRQAAGGASYGGHLANWLQATTTHFKCLIAHAGLVNSESQWGTSDVIWGRELMNGGAPWVPTKTWKEQNPMRFAANFKTPMLMTVGENDFRVPINNTLENWSIHQRLKIPSKLIVFPGENHWILNPENSKFHYQEVGNWLSTYLK
jgi:dipeptidyl aminopeptidase/acylaminoacyl peptidase